MRKIWHGVFGVLLCFIIYFLFVLRDAVPPGAETESLLPGNNDVLVKSDGSAASTMIESDIKLEADFENPPKAYGPIPLWWWAGEPLNKERLKWQLDQLHDKGVSSACVLYPYKLEYIKGDKTPYSYDPAYEPGSMTMVPDMGEPPVFSAEWWDFYRWIIKECKKRGMTIWFSDYTRNDEAQKKLAYDFPELQGRTLECTKLAVKPFETIKQGIADGCEIISATAYPLSDYSQGRSFQKINLVKFVKADTLLWSVAAGYGTVYIITAKAGGFDALRPNSGAKLADYLYGEFDRQCPGELGKTVGGFFTDELTVSRSRIRWDENFEKEFLRQKGYGIIPLLPALWHDVGPKTAKIRIDYYDVLIFLMEKNFFKPTFEYMENHGLLHAFDQAGRHSMQVQALCYGDFYRTMRWYNAPGYDDYGAKPAGQRNFRNAKLSSSIAHLYQRPRVWCEAFHSSGWGLTPANMTAWTNENYVYGANLYDFHGLYYTTYGGWWEWAPPSAHFRQPYWRHYNQFSGYISRLSFLLSQGVHRCDVAILYPTTTIQAGLSGADTFSQEAIDADAATWGLGLDFFRQAVDFDYMDYESLESAEIYNKKLTIRGNEFRVLLLPTCSAIRFKGLEKALRFYRAGGVVLAYGCLPSRSDLDFDKADKLDAMVRELFGLTAQEAMSAKNVQIQQNKAGGVVGFFPGAYAFSYPADLSNFASNSSFVPLAAVFDSSICRDFRSSAPNVYVLHRVLDRQHVYFIYNVADQITNTDVFFHAVGWPSRWDAWSGSIIPIGDFRQDVNGTTLTLTLEPHEAQLIVFSNEKNTFKSRSLVPDLAGKDSLLKECQQDNPAFGSMTEFSSRKQVHADITLQKQAFRSSSMVLDGFWEFELTPTLDNRWGDFRLPATQKLIGAEAKRFKYSDSPILDSRWQQPSYDDTDWQDVTYSFGPYFWQLGPFDSTADVKNLQIELAKMESFNSVLPIESNLYTFSRRWGIENDPVLITEYENAVGLKQHVPDEFIDLGIHKPGTFYYLWTTVSTDQPRTAYLNLATTGPCRAWVNGQPVLEKNGVVPVALRSGTNTLLLRLEQRRDVRIRSYAVLGDKPRIAKSFIESISAHCLGLRWFDHPADPVYDVYPNRQQRIGQYRFLAPPGLDKMTIVAHGLLKAWIQGHSATVTEKEKQANGAVVYQVVPTKYESNCSVVALCIDQIPGLYAGAAIPEPIGLDCVRGQTPLVDWSQMGLSTYSGVAHYFKTFQITKQQVECQIELDLGQVSVTAEVIVNGKNVGIRFAPPFCFNISSYLIPGQNHLEVIVANTLANHYRVGIPTKFISEVQMASGLLGPVKLKLIPHQ